MDYEYKVVESVVGASLEARGVVGVNNAGSKRGRSRRRDVAVGPIRPIGDGVGAILSFRAALIISSRDSCLETENT